MGLQPIDDAVTLGQRHTLLQHQLAQLFTNLLANAYEAMEGRGHVAISAGATRVEDGLDGLECEYGRYSPETRARLRSLADRHSLAVTGGSDYHGRYKPDLELGTGLPVNPVSPEEAAAELLETARAAAIETRVATGPRSWDEFVTR